MIGVVGGGIAGLAAARRLQQLGHDVTVFEANEDLGGLATTYETAGDPVEAFYHHLSKSEETIVEWIDELGLDDALEWRYGSDAYYVDGVVHPMDKPWEILAYPHLSIYDKFRLGMLVLDVDVRGGIPSFDTYERLEDFEDVPVKGFVLDHTSRGCFERFFKPLLEAKFGDRWADVSAAWLLGRIKFRGERDLLKGEQLGYLAGGFGQLTDALVETVGKMDIFTESRATDIRIKDGVVDSVTVETEYGEVPHAVDGVVVATMPDVLESLTGYACDIDFQGTVCSVISMEKPLTDTYWLNIADDAPFGALIEHTNYVPPERYGGEHLLYAVKYVQGPEDDLWQMDDQAVEETWLSGIEDLFPDFDRDSVNWIQTSRNPKTAPIYERGYLEKVIPYDLSEEVADGVYYAGMASRAQYPERSLDGAIVAGETVAERIGEAQ
ncbi:protoporphyrinogen oxidase protein [Halorhabdus tiamatea SARL4B]|uniref:Phytoene desaturase n=1 Tax=Halorhabdus tiamatea SARL4B TaxID=1033806 RepID=F7PI83_9EURY|nr:NAD(P)/FAD-dependent oxidoreductase [Halorhabdus tiamatea]ERJ05258.1 protoporphyrinogen oxidase protein [Halorhabdus tiamatea SARL4B]CCQ32171.1 phytoene desaturase [Halorhabdus tiamatea SARL4B]